MIAGISADTKSNLYQVIHNKKADIVAISVKIVSSNAECAIQCTLTEGCSRVNWSPSNWELLGETGEIRFIEDSNYKHFGKYNMISFKRHIGDSVLFGLNQNLGSILVFVLRHQANSKR